MKKGPFKMKKFSGFGSSPARQTAKEKFDLRQASKQKAKDFAKDPRIKRKIDIKDTYKKAKTKMAPKRLPKNLILGQSYEGFSDAEWARFEKANKAASIRDLKKFGRAAGRALGAAGVATTLYDMYKSGQKHSGGKAWKGQKTGIIKPQGDFWKKAKSKTKSIYKK